MKTTVSSSLFALLLLPMASAVAEPFGYSVNSDEPDGDELHRINLATGVTTEIGEVLSGDLSRRDIEGLAFDATNTLWAVDDESDHLFPISLGDGQVLTAQERSISGFDDSFNNDLGMTFTCDNDLFVVSVANQSLYSLTLEGQATLIGKMGYNISAIASYGTDGQLYGLGNGLLSEGGPRDNRTLFKIDSTTAVATPIGELGNAAADYFSAGLSFDNDGNLWAITDRRTSQQELGSQLLRLNTATGEATLVSTTINSSGFEGLAIAPPQGCAQAIDDDEYHPIPTLGQYSLVLAILSLFATGGLFLRRTRD